MIELPTTIRIKQRNPLKMRNIRDERKILFMTTMNVSIPLEVKLRLDNLSGKQGRSAFVTRILKQWFAQQKETDPRFLLKMKEMDFEAWKIENKANAEKIEIRFKQIKEEQEHFKILSVQKQKEFEEQIEKLQLLANTKKEELLRDLV